MADPISSFLAGFAVVDQLETNRIKRRALGQQMSHMRKVWQRQDDEWGRSELRRIQNERTESYVANMDQFHRDITIQADKLKESGGDEAKAKFLNQTYMQIDSEERINMEVLNRMALQDPSVFEHFAFSMGHDPAAGAAVIDKKNPVSSMGMFPSSMNPSGKLAFFFQVPTADGDKPLTEGRSSRPEDKVALRSPGMASMTRFFGPSIMISRTNSLIRLRHQVMAGDDREIGDPRTEDAATPLSLSAPPSTPEPKVQSQEDFEANRAEYERLQLEKEFGGGGKPQIFPPVFESDEANNRSTPSTPEPTNRVRSSRTITEMLTGKAFPTATEDAIADVRARSTGRFIERRSQNFFEQSSFDKGKRVREGTLDRVDALGTVGKALASDVATMAIDTIKNLSGPGKSFLAGLLDTPATPSKDYPPSKTNLPDEVSRENALKDPDKAIKSAAGSIKTKGDLEKAASSLAAASRSKRRVPYPNETYFAAGMVEAEVITKEQFQQFTRTGSFDAAVEARFQHIGDGLIMRTLSDGGVDFFQAPGTSGTKDTVKARKAVREEIRAQVEHEFLLPDGAINERGLQQFMNAQEEIFHMLGVPEGDVRRTNSTFLNQLARGSRFVQRFDEDDIQYIDLKWGDFEVPYTAGNVAIASVLSATGITSQEAATYALRTYLRDAKPAGRLDDAGLLKFVQDNEGEIRRQWQASQADGEYVLPSGKVIKSKDSLEDVRDAIIGDFVYIDNGR